MYDLSTALCNLQTELEIVNTLVRELSDFQSEHSTDVLVPLDEYKHLVEDANRWAHRPVEPQEPVRTICDCSDCQRRAY